MSTVKGQLASTRSRQPKQSLYDFLAKGGKYSRPFITLAAYDSLTGGNCSRPDDAIMHVNH